MTSSVVCATDNLSAICFQSSVEDLQQLTKFDLSHMAGKRDLAPALLKFLQEQWREHILKSDQEYGKFLKEKGVPADDPMVAPLT